MFRKFGFQINKYGYGTKEISSYFSWKSGNILLEIEETKLQKITQNRNIFRQIK